jgi:hypothetical protein
MEEFKREYKKLLNRLNKAEKFFLDPAIDDDKKLKFVDEFNKIQREIVKMQREYKDIFNADIEESLKHLD